MCNCQQNIHGIGAPLKLPKNLGELLSGDTINGVLLAKNDPRTPPVPKIKAPTPVMQHAVITPEQLQEVIAGVKAREERAAQMPERKYVLADASKTAMNTGFSTQNFWGTISKEHLMLGGAAVAVAIFLIANKNR